MSDDELRRAAETIALGDYGAFDLPPKEQRLWMAAQKIAVAYLADQAEMHAGGSDPTPGPAPVPLTEVELRMVEQWASSPPQDGHDRLILRLAAECRRLRAQVVAALAAVEGIDLREGHIRDNADPDQLRAMLLGAGLAIVNLRAQVAGHAGRPF